MANQNSGAWTEGEDAILRTLWPKGFSASEISSRLRNRSRNSVIGRITRLGLSALGRAEPVKPARNAKSASVKAPRPKAPAQPVLGVPFPVVAPEVADAARAAAASKGRKAANAFLIPANDDSIPLLSRRRFQCAWPVGRPPRPAEQLCCGQPVDPTGNKAVASCCAHHAGLAVARVLKGGAPDEKRYERAMRRWAA